MRSLNLSFHQKGIQLSKLNQKMIQCFPENQFICHHVTNEAFHKLFLGLFQIVEVVRIKVTMVKNGLWQI